MKTPALSLALIALQLSVVLGSKGSQDVGVADMRLPQPDGSSACFNSLFTSTTTVTITPTLRISVTTTETGPPTTAISTQVTTLTTLTADIFTSTFYLDEIITTTVTTSTTTVTDSVVSSLPDRRATQPVSPPLSVARPFAVDVAAQGHPSTVVVTKTVTAEPTTETVVVIAIEVPGMITSTTTTVTEGNTVPPTTTTTTTTVTRSSTSTTDVVATTAVPPPEPMLGQFQIFRVDAPPRWGLLTVLSKRSGGFGRLQSRASQADGDDFLWTANRKPIIDSVTLIGQMIGANLYFNPTSDIYGPNSGGGRMSSVVGIPDGDQPGLGSQPIDCELDADARITCFWDPVQRTVAEWVFCDDVLSLAAPGVTYTNYCTSSSAVLHVDFVPSV